MFEGKHYLKKTNSFSIKENFVQCDHFAALQKTYLILKIFCSIWTFYFPKGLPAISKLDAMMHMNLQVILTNLKRFFCFDSNSIELVHE